MFLVECLFRYKEIFHSSLPSPPPQKKLPMVIFGHAQGLEYLRNLFPIELMNFFLNFGLISLNTAQTAQNIFLMKIEHFDDLKCVV